MTLRITQMKVGEAVQIRLAGRMTSKEARHLLRTLERDGNARTLDLTDLLWADESAIEVLRQLSARGVKLLHATPYVAMLLSQDGHEDLCNEEQPE